MEEYIQRAYGNADVHWKKAASMALRQVASRKARFTTDDIYAVMPLGLSTYEPRAMGGVVRQAKSEGIIASTGEYQLSGREVNHSRPISIWQSLLYSG